jgi:hypothetical protein
VDPEGCRKWVVGVRGKFEATIDAELGMAPAKKAPAKKPPR